MKNIELIDKAINKFNGAWPKNKFGIFCSDKYQAAILLCLATPTDDTDAKVGEIHCGSTGCDSHYFEVICTEPEFLARKAERQSKPSWDDAPDWAQYLAQNNVGDWWWYPKCEIRPGMGAGCFSNKAKDCCEKAGDGEVIGDWRHTLEQRPNHIGEANEKAVTEADWPDEKRIDVVATNGNDGLHYAAKAPEFKHGSGSFNLVDDNDWHSRGELPPMGTECEYTIGDNFGGFKPCHFVGLNSRGSLVVEGADGILKQFHKHQINLRPLRTDREKFVETVTALARKKDVNSHEDLAGVIFDAGFRAPEVK